MKYPDWCLYRIVIALFVALLLSACSDQSDDPEELLKQTLDQMEQAAEERSIGELMDLVDDGFRDDDGRSWKDVRAMVQLQFIKNPKIHSFKIIKSISLRDDRNASVVMLVALAGRPIDNSSILTGLRAELMRFELDFILDQSWKVKGGSWHRAEAADFLQ